MVNKVSQQLDRFYDATALVIAKDDCEEPLPSHKDFYCADSYIVRKRLPPKEEVETKTEKRTKEEANPEHLGKKRVT